MFDRLLLIFMGVFFLLYALFAVTNIEVAWGEPIKGFAALGAGVVCVIRALK